MTEVAERRMTLEDLHRFDGRAELIGGRLVELPMPGFTPGRVAFGIGKSLNAYALRTGRGFGQSEGIDFAVPTLPSGRESFRPDAFYFTQSPPADGMEFVEGPPRFAVEVRSKNDYGPAAEETMAAKRADYFAGGTLVVWDVDPVAATVASYRRASPDRPTVCRRGDTADAEPAVPGWRMAADDIFGRA
jgi:Uma2 family endonuclease